MPDDEKWMSEAGPCLRCGHGPWRPRVPGKPLVCPKCKSPRWDKPRQDEVKPKKA